MSRILHSQDLTGQEIERALIQAVEQNKRIRLIENATAIDLLTEHNLIDNNDFEKLNKHCWGGFVLNSKTNVVLKILANATVIATGGLGQVYLHTTNPIIATGDGFAIAYRAGVKLANMEFIQFHPTSFYNIKNSSEFEDHSFLISEAVRGYGAVLRAKDGSEFMINYDKRKELAPRDIVARAIDNELKKRGDDFVYLDITHKDSNSIKEHFPNIYETCIKQGIDITKDFIPVVPAAHYACGGVVVNLKSETSLSGLYACGEVTMTGVHGANRLASNSLLEAVVYAKHCADSIKEYLNKNIIVPELLEWDDSGTLSQDEKILLTHSTKEVKQTMWDYVGIVRSNLRLDRAAKRLQNLESETDLLYKKTKVVNELLELRNLISCSQMIVKCAQLRKESRGLHFSLDYPELKTNESFQNTLI